LILLISVDWLPPYFSPSSACLILDTRVGRGRLLTPSRVTPNRGRASARTTSFGFVLSRLDGHLLGDGFVDDIVVRVRPRPDGSLVDVRSKSRDGQGDLGANAARIRQLANALR
jgi:hypothetical protein